MKAPVSLCMIVKDEPKLEECLLSIKDYVEEIVIVDTGSKDPQTIEIAKKYANIFEVYTKCNNPETGFIEDFSKARQHSFDLATKPWVMWMDSDDLIVGGDKLHEIIKTFEANKKGLRGVGFMFPYEYSYDQTGKVNCLHYRERLLTKGLFKWVNPVHEVLVPIDNTDISLITVDDIIWKHRRQFNPKPTEPGRNLRILRKYVAGAGKDDARQLYYLGLECLNNGFVDEAIGNLTKYIDISGWEDERVMACLKLVDIYYAKGDYDAGLKWGFKSIEIKENWGEGYFALAKMFYHFALKGGANETRNWERCVHFARTGLALPPTKTVLFVNPSDRELDIHRYLNMALNKLGDVKGALESVETGLKYKSDDSQLLNNKKFYEVFLAKQKATESVNKLFAVGEIDAGLNNAIIEFLNKKTLDPSKETNLVAKNTNEWNIPSTYSFEELPINITDDQLQSTIIMLWKQYMLHDNPDKAIKFLENVPPHIANSVAVKEALEITTSYLDSLKIPETENWPVKKNENPLDIIMFAGDGVETWTPETVKITGIGGSELMLLEQAKRLVKLGHKVRVYNSCGNSGVGTYDGVEYHQTPSFTNLTCDVLIVSRRADMLGDQYNIQAKLKLLWVHDIFAICASNEVLLKADRILALSEWHKNFLISHHNIHPDHVIVTRNGIDLRRFEKKIHRNRFRCVNSSSPDRSWPILLDVWPRIREQVPQAELHLFYGFKNWEFSAQNDPKQTDLINRLKYQINNMKSIGVCFHDRVNQNQLAEEFLHSGVWTYPTWFTETSCITAMEAQAAGLRMVTSNIAALQETAGSRAVLLDGQWTSDEYKNQFVDSVVKALKDEDTKDRDALQQYAREHFDLNMLAEDWEKMFYNLIEELKTNPIVPYQPSPVYR